MTVSTINYTNQSFDYNSISENCLPFILTCGPICINSVTATISQLLRRLFLFTWSNQLSQRGIFFQLFPGPTRFLTPLYKPLLYLLHSSSQSQFQFRSIYNFNFLSDSLNFPVLLDMEVKAMAVFFAIVAILSAVASAQEPTLAPAPSPDQGAAFSLPISSAIICSSLIFSVAALLRN